MQRTETMRFREEELREIGEYVKEHLPEWLVQRDIELRESQVRLETELKGQRELLRQNMTLMGKRFEQVDKRFEQVDKRFEQVDRRFESMETRLINLETSIRRFIYSSFSFTAAAAGVIIAVVKLA